MPGKLLLIADDARFAELRASSDLPESWLPAATADSLLAQLARDPPWILGCAPELLLPAEGAHDQAEVLNNLLDCTICYLAVVGRPVAEPARVPPSSAPAGGTGMLSDPATKEEIQEHSAASDPSPLHAHAAWYERFRTELKAKVKARHVHARHVLILVCCQDPPADQLPHFQRLVEGNGPDKLFHACYIMLEELEPGRGPGNYFNAEHVWPVAVGGLLLKLLHDPPRHRAAASTAYAWRCYTIMPDIAPADQERLCAARFSSLVKFLTAGASAAGVWDSSRFTRFQSRVAVASEVDLPAPRNEQDSFAAWLDYRPSARLDEVRQQRRWEPALARAGDELGRRLSWQALNEEPAAWTEVVKIWNAIHQQPAFTYTALSDRDIVRGPPLGDQFETMSRHWQRILDKDRQRQEQLDNAAGCAAHFSAAQQSFVNLIYRFAAIGAVTVLVGWLAMGVFHNLLGTWGLPSLVAFAGALGALIAGLASYDCEQRSGRRARDAFEQSLSEIDELARQRHECCQDAVDTANVFRQQLCAKAAAARLKQVLARLVLVLDRELQYVPDPPGNAATNQIAGRDGQPPTGGRESNQRTRFRRQTGLWHKVDVTGVEQGREAQELDEFITAQAAAFRDELWSPFCEDHDPLRCGHLPARLLIPAVRGFRRRFQLALLAKVRILSLKRLLNRDLSAWGDDIRDVLAYQEYFELMSCRLLAHQTAPDGNRPLPRLYLRRGFDAAPLVKHLNNSRLAGPPELSEYLEALPIAGFLFEELPVRFAASERQTIGVAVRQGPTP